MSNQESPAGAELPDLSPWGISNPTEIVYNPSYDVLYAEETASSLTGFDCGFITSSGAISVDTGEFYRALTKR